MAAREKLAMPDLSNATDGFIVDEMGKLAVMESRVKALRKYYREALLARLKIPAEGEIVPLQVSGETTFVGNVSRNESTRLDQTAIKEEFDQDWIDAHSKTSEVTTVRFALKEGAVNPAVTDLLTQMMRELDLE